MNGNFSDLATRCFLRSAKLPNRLMKTSLIVATLLIVAALAVDLLAPLLLNS